MGIVQIQQVHMVPWTSCASIYHRSCTAHKPHEQRRLDSQKAGMLWNSRRHRLPLLQGWHRLCLSFLNTSKLKDFVSVFKPIQGVLSRSEWVNETWSISCPTTMLRPKKCKEQIQSDCSNSQLSLRFFPAWLSHPSEMWKCSTLWLQEVQIGTVWIGAGGQSSQRISYHRLD